MGESKLFKQYQDINNFADMLALKRYSKAIFKCKRWNWAPPFLFAHFGGLHAERNNAQSSLSTQILENIQPQHQQVESH